MAATDGRTVDLASLAGRTVVHVQPRTGVPGILDDGVVARAFHPVFSPERNAPDVLDWLRANAVA